MPKKTIGVQQLVEEVLRTLRRPYSEDIIDEVCLAIERKARWRQRYDELANELRYWVVNNWIGQYVATHLGWKRGRQVPAKSKLIRTYSKLHP